MHTDVYGNIGLGTMFTPISGMALRMAEIDNFDILSYRLVVKHGFSHIDNLSVGIETLPLPQEWFFQRYVFRVHGGHAWFSHTVSADHYIDRTPYPKSLEQAYEAVLSMQRLPDDEYDEKNSSKQLDHNKMSDFIKVSLRRDEIHRDLSATVSAQNEVIKDLINKIDVLTKRIETLENNNNE